MEKLFCTSTTLFNNIPITLGAYDINGVFHDIFSFVNMDKVNGKKINIKLLSYVNNTFLPVPFIDNKTINEFGNMDWRVPVDNHYLEGLYAKAYSFTAYLAQNNMLSQDKLVNPQSYMVSMNNVKKFISSNEEFSSILKFEKDKYEKKLEILRNAREARSQEQLQQVQEQQVVKQTEEQLVEEALPTVDQIASKQALDSQPVDSPIQEETERKVVAENNQPTEQVTEQKQESLPSQEVTSVINTEEVQNSGDNQIDYKRFEELLSALVNNKPTNELFLGCILFKMANKINSEFELLKSFNINSEEVEFLHDFIESTEESYIRNSYDFTISNLIAASEKDESEPQVVKLEPQYSEPKSQFVEPITMQKIENNIQEPDPTEEAEVIEPALDHEPTTPTTEADSIIETVNPQQSNESNLSWNESVQEVEDLREVEESHNQEDPKKPVEEVQNSIPTYVQEQQDNINPNKIYMFNPKLEDDMRDNTITGISIQAADKILNNSTEVFKIPFLGYTKLEEDMQVAEALYLRICKDKMYDNQTLQVISKFAERLNKALKINSAEVSFIEYVNSLGSVFGDRTPKFLEAILSFSVYKAESYTTFQGLPYYIYISIIIANKIFQVPIESNFMDDFILELVSGSINSKNTDIEDEIDDFFDDDYDEDKGKDEEVSEEYIFVNTFQGHSKKLWKEVISSAVFEEHNKEGVEMSTIAKLQLIYTSDSLIKATSPIIKKGFGTDLTFSLSNGAPFIKDAVGTDIDLTVAGYLIFRILSKIDSILVNTKTNCEKLNRMDNFNIESANNVNTYIEEQLGNPEYINKYYSVGNGSENSAAGSFLNNPYINYNEVVRFLKTTKFNKKSAIYDMVDINNLSMLTDLVKADYSVQGRVFLVVDNNLGIKGFPETTKKFPIQLGYYLRLEDNDKSYNTKNFLLPVITDSKSMEYINITNSELKSNSVGGNGEMVANIINDPTGNDIYIKDMDAKLFLNVLTTGSSFGPDGKPIPASALDIIRKILSVKYLKMQLVPVLTQNEPILNEIMKQFVIGRLKKFIQSI